MKKRNESHRRMPRACSRSDRSGFTLIEVLIAIIILGISFGALAAAFSTGLMGVRAARETSTAVHAAQQEIENMRNMSFSAIQTRLFTVPSINGAGTVTSQLEGGTTDLKKVAVNVSWVSGGRRPMSVSMATYFTRNGINRK
ncbi:MAG: type II secretion system protein [bacterium]|nr:type II secretion system protein [bacterium]